MSYEFFVVLVCVGAWLILMGLIVLGSCKAAGDADERAGYK